MTPTGRIADSSASTSDLVADFGAAAFDSAIQRPINGLTQLVGKVVNYDLPQLNVVELPKANTGSEVFAQQAGAAVGMLVPFFGSRAIVRGVAGSRLGTGYGAMALEGGATGMLMGAVFTPVDKDQPFWVTRAANGFTDAGTFSVLGLAGKAVSSAKALGITAETPLISRIGKGALAGSVSALPAGFVHAELHSLTRGNGFASGAEVAGDMTGFALFGGILGGAGGARANSRFRPVVEGDGRGKGTKAPETGELASPDTAPVPGRAPVIQEGRGGNRAPETVEKPGEAKPPEKILKVKKEGYIGEGDEGFVYSNGDGSVTKVYKDAGRSMEAMKDIFEKLNSIGIKTPKILEYGKTQEGQPAMRMEQVGDGDPLRMQLIMREIQGADMVALRKQYYAYADALKEAGIRIDWNLKNMRFQDGQLYILDPSFLKNETLSEATIQMFAGMIGPRK